MKNPYIFGPPIRGAEDFIGRRHEIETIQHWLRNAASVSLVGERRVGKTSLLYYLRQAIRSSPHDRDQMVPIIINAQLRIVDEPAFLSKVTHELVRAMPALKAPSQPGDDLSALVWHLEEMAPKRLVMLIDEFEELADNPLLSPEFYTTLRGIAENYQVSIVTATRSALGTCCHKFSISSRFSEYFQPVRLGPYSDQDLASFVRITSERSGLDLTGYLSQIRDIAGGFPAYVQLACMHYFDALAKTPSEPMSLEGHQEIRRSFSYQVEPYFRHIWEEDLDDEKRDALTKAAQGWVDGNSRTVQELKDAGFLVGGKVFSSVFVDLFLESAPAPATMAAGAAVATKTVGIWLDENGEVWRDGERIAPPLTKLQYSLLSYLYKNRGRISSKYDIVVAVWSEDYVDEVEDHRISKLVSRLRERIEPTPSDPRYLITVHGRGYRLEA